MKIVDKTKTNETIKQKSLVSETIGNKKKCGQQAEVRVPHNILKTKLINYYLVIDVKNLNKCLPPGYNCSK